MCGNDVSGKYISKVRREISSLVSLLYENNFCCFVCFVASPVFEMATINPKSSNQIRSDFCRTSSPCYTIQEYYVSGPGSAELIVKILSTDSSWQVPFLAKWSLTTYFFSLRQICAPKWAFETISALPLARYLETSATTSKAKNYDKHGEWKRRRERAMFHKWCWGVWPVHKPKIVNEY